MPSKGRCFALDKRQCLPPATKVQQQSSSILPSYPKDVLVDQETAQKDLFSHRNLAPSGKGVRSGSPGLVGGPRLLLYVDSQGRGREEGVRQEERNCCS